MHVIVCATFTLILVAGSCHASPVEDLGFVKGFVSQTGQDEHSLAESMADRNLHRNIMGGEPTHMHIDLPKAQKVKKNDTKPISEEASHLGLTALSNDISRAKLRDALEEKGPFTLFGPTNEAFRNMPKWAKEAIKDRDILAKYLKFHVLKGEFSSKKLQNELLAETLLGDKLRVNIYKKGKTVVCTAQCAPVNLTRIDNDAANGVIHVLDGVIIPPDGHAVAALSGHKEFSTLVQAVKAASLVETLSEAGPFTIFAPTNDAFAKLPPGTLHKLLRNPQELAKILKYHVLPGTFCSRGLESGDVKTAEGQSVKIKVSDDGVTVNNAKVVLADGSITNGVIHVIDTVLLPPVYHL